MYVSGGGGVWSWQRLWWWARVRIKHISKTPRAVDGGFTFQLLPKQFWTAAVLEGNSAPSSCGDGKAPRPFMLRGVLFCFDFCFVTGETLGNGLSVGQRQPRAPARRAVPSGACAPQPHRNASAGQENERFPSDLLPHSHGPLATSYSPDGSVARGEPTIQLSGSSPNDRFFVRFLFMSFPGLSLWLTTTNTGTVHSCYFGLNPHRINF